MLLFEKLFTEIGSKIVFEHDFFCSKKNVEVNVEQNKFNHDNVYDNDNKRGS